MNLKLTAVCFICVIHTAVSCDITLVINRIALAAIALSLPVLTRYWCIHVIRTVVESNVIDGKAASVGLGLVILCGDKDL